MTAASIKGFLTKKEVQERYGRSHRSLTRDFSSAVRVKDREVLTHLKVLTDDGTVREGTDVTLEQIQELSNNGLSPTWYIEGGWAAVRYGARSEPRAPSTPLKSRGATASAGEPPVLLADENQLVRRLEGQIQDLQRDKEKLYDELSIKNEQIKQANERTRESNVLMRELQTLLGDVQQRALLPIPVQQGQSSSVDVVVHDDELRQPATQPMSKVPVPKARHRSGADSKRKHKVSSPASPKGSVDVKAKGNQKPKRDYFPTFRKLFSRR